MQLKEWGEENFVNFLKEQFPAQSPITGIGDDCAVIPDKEGNACLITTDALSEGIHFLRDQILPSQLGYKAIAVNVSDISAMGGLPQYAFLTLALPKETDAHWVQELIQGIKRACTKWQIQLLGGDTVGSLRDILINLTLLGTAPVENVKYRHQAQLNDVICVTAPLGDSGGGLLALKQHTSLNNNIQKLIQAHFNPTPNLEQGTWLGGIKFVHAMMDLSDGLDQDLKRLMKGSQKGADIETTKIPLSKDLCEACYAHQWDPLKLALTGGEDYCLLLTIDSDAFPEIQYLFQMEFDSPLYEIGRITNSQKLTYLKKGEVLPLKYYPFNHFE
ncbi:MAG: thiamine-phosphate kinase [Parachlamydiales bacterium]|jgi:thiamine-monophosphate kinase